MTRVEHILQQSAERWPEHTAIIDEYGRLSFQQLYTHTESLQQQLLKAGLKKGQGLGVMGRNSRAFVAAMFAGMGCGATVIPLSHQLKQAELDTVLAETALHAVIDDGFANAFVPATASTLTFQNQPLNLRWTQAPPTQPVVKAFEAAFIRYTSGTTGKSKGVVLSHQSVLARIKAAQAALQLSHDDIVLWVLPMAFHFLVTISLYLYRGVTFVIAKDILAQTLMDAINRYQVTFLYAAPMHFRLLAADQSATPLSSLRRAISTSSAIPPQVADAFSQRFGMPLTQAYGIIEAGLPLLDHERQTAAPETVGYPTPAFEVALFDQALVSTAAGQTGQLAIRGPGLFDAYLKPWQNAESVMYKGWFLTGDLAQQRTDGKIMICGRKKTMINVAGNKAFPEEIEAVLIRYPGIADAYVYGKAHLLMGEVVCADICLQPGCALETESILRFCRRYLSTYKIPQWLYKVQQIAHTDSGKIRR